MVQQGQPTYPPQPNHANRRVRAGWHTQPHPYNIEIASNLINIISSDGESYCIYPCQEPRSNLCVLGGDLRRQSNSALHPPSPKQWVRAYTLCRLYHVGVADLDWRVGTLFFLPPMTMHHDRRCVLWYGPRPLKLTERHGHFLNSTG